MLLGSQQTQGVSRRRSVSLDRGRIVGGVLRQLPSVSNSPRILCPAQSSLSHLFYSFVLAWRAVRNMIKCAGCQEKEASRLECPKCKK